MIQLLLSSVTTFDFFCLGTEFLAVESFGHACMFPALAFLLFDFGCVWDMARGGGNKGTGK